MENKDTTENEDVDSDPSQLNAARRLFEHWFKSDYYQRTRKQNENDEHDKKDKCKQ